jgi:hypothetical protein
MKSTAASINKTLRYLASQAGRLTLFSCLFFSASSYATCPNDYGVIAEGDLKVKDRLQVQMGYMCGARDVEIFPNSQIGGVDLGHPGIHRTKVEAGGNLKLNDDSALCGYFHARSLAAVSGALTNQARCGGPVNEVLVTNNAVFDNYSLTGDVKIGGDLQLLNDINYSGPGFHYGGTKTNTTTGGNGAAASIFQGGLSVPAPPTCGFVKPAINAPNWGSGVTNLNAVVDHTYDANGGVASLGTVIIDAGLHNIRFNTGTYYFEELLIKGDARLTIDPSGPTGIVNIYVRKNFEFGQGSQLTVMGGALDMFTIFVLGEENGSVVVGPDTSFQGALWTVANDFTVGDRASLDGGFYGYNVNIGTDFKLIGARCGALPTPPPPTPTGTPGPSGTPTPVPTPTPTPTPSCPVYGDLGSQPLLQANRLPSRNTLVDSRNQQIIYSGYDAYAGDVTQRPGGQLKAYTFAEADGVLSIGPTVGWDAVNKMNARGVNSSDLFMTTDTAGENGVALQDTVISAAPTAQLADIRSGALSAGIEPSVIGNINVFAPALIDYVKGSAASEGQYGFADRDNLLGTILHSEPNLLGRSRKIIRPLVGDDPSLPPYIEFYNGTQQRRSYAVVGANDGYLRFVDATPGEVDSGKVALSYLSNAMLNKVPKLAGENDLHEFFFDGKITIGDYFSKSANQWQTLTLATCGYGGSCVVALNTTYETSLPSTPASLLKWEFSNADAPADLKMGYTVGQPSIARLKEAGWVAIFANGYAGDATKAGILVVSLDDKSKMKAIVVPNNAPPAGITFSNGLPAMNTLDYNADGLTDYAYGCDRFGRCWQFDLADVDFTSATPRPPVQIFETIDNQPVFNQPQLRINEDNLQVSILFGTGKFDSPADQTDQTRQHFYALFVNPANPAPIAKPELEFNKVVLDQQTIVGDYKVRSVKYAQAEIAAPKGWYFVLPESGERVITDALVLSNYVFFSTIIPDASKACNGTMNGWLNILDAETGLQPKENYIDMDDDGVIDSKPAGFSINGATISGPSIVPAKDDNSAGYMVFGINKANANNDVPPAKKAINLQMKKGRTSWITVQ